MRYKRIISVMLVLGMSSSTISFAYAALTGCDFKRADIEQKITQAKVQGNVYQIKGLEKALQDVNDYCSNDSLRKDLEEKVTKQENELRERQDDLQEAINKGDADKILKRKEKLAEAQKELQDARNQLNMIFPTE